MSPYITNKKYPLIYEKENLSVIDENKKTNGLNMNEQTIFFEKTGNEANNGRKEGLYYNLLIKTSKNYWLASRCVYTDLEECSFRIRYINNGYVGAFSMYFSDDNTNHSSCALFPILSLGSSLITGDKTTGFTVKLN